MLILQGISYTHPNNDLLFEKIDLTINRHEKAALVGRNGSGKSTLLRIIANELLPASGQLTAHAKPYYVPQLSVQYDHLTVGQALNVSVKLKALQELLGGNGSEENYNLLEDDWTIGDRCTDALKHWQLDHLDLAQTLGSLSGGQKTKVFLAGIAIHQPELILLDEPTNHLDSKGRRLLYGFIRSTKSTLVVVSHDRQLLDLTHVTCELNRGGITAYGGNYAFYAAQKEIANTALAHALQNKEKALRRAEEIQKETLARQHKLDARGKKKQEKAGIARIMMNSLRNRAENSTSKIKAVHHEKTEAISRELQALRLSVPDLQKMKLGFDDPALHTGKILIDAAELNYSYRDRPIWEESLTVRIVSGERVALQGLNGSGKTTLIRLISGELLPSHGTVKRASFRSVYVDQDYSLISNPISVYEQAQAFNTSALQEHEVKTRLSRFLFAKDDWNKSCMTLSGGEKMRLMLCCLTMDTSSPEMIVLDEPTNNLDIENVEILTAALNAYGGTLIVVSHDACFLDQLNIGRYIELS